MRRHIVFKPRPQINFMHKNLLIKAAAAVGGQSSKPSGLKVSAEGSTCTYVTKL